MSLVRICVGAGLATFMIASDAMALPIDASVAPASPVVVTPVVNGYGPQAYGVYTHRRRHSRRGSRTGGPSGGVPGRS